MAKKDDNMKPKLVNRTMAFINTMVLITLWCLYYMPYIYIYRRIHGVNLQQRINHPRDFTEIGT